MHERHPFTGNISSKAVLSLILNLVTVVNRLANEVRSNGNDVLSNWFYTPSGLLPFQGQDRQCNQPGVEEKPDSQDDLAGKRADRRVFP